MLSLLVLPRFVLFLWTLLKLGCSSKRKLSQEMQRPEGAAALWKGIIPALHRQCIYGGLRIGLYEPDWVQNTYLMSLN
ncbi:hypothetical protein Dsin_028533 [Dipteronia sinensis]|uniref:Secreted protein n=1 Tax=Dipteronia sinensis TaxID=43782 RepID=A0AAD9ZR08_9ROSI|nr:hypothetical protein Dsin_028533 [Dipteronia sinensis]